MRYIKSHGENDIVSDSTVEALIVDLLAWLAETDRTYEEVMSTWRTSCPKLPVWEDANDRGFVATVATGGRKIVRVSSKGLEWLKRRGMKPAVSKPLTSN